jgi:hypothetical protein
MEDVGDGAVLRNSPVPEKLINIIDQTGIFRLIFHGAFVEFSNEDVCGVLKACIVIPKGGIGPNLVGLKLI